MLKQSTTGRKADAARAPRAAPRAPQRQPKRLAVDLTEITSEVAAPMSEAPQRTAVVEPPPKTANLQALAFKVSPAFRKRFRQRAATADLKLNELLFEALTAWEEKHGIER